MKALIAALLLANYPHPPGADAPPSSVGSAMPPAWPKQPGGLFTQHSHGEREKAAKGEGDRVAAVDEVIRRYDLAGEVLVAKGGRILLERGYGTIAPSGDTPHKAGERWRLASITKQVTAALAVQQVWQGRLGLDTPIGFLPKGKPFTVTARQLLTHHSGLANPDETADVSGVPGFYRQKAPDLSFCTSRPAVPASPFSYNNCDYILLADTMSDLAPRSLTARWPTGMTMARAGEKGIPGFVGGKPEPAFELASWGAAGGLMGTARAVFDFDRSLMTSKLLPPASLAELWKPEGSGSYQALGQWVFPGKLKGCAAAKRIVQRDGEIYGVQARNFILPDDDLVVIVFTNRSSDDFKMGEVWESKGFVYDLLSAAAAC